MSEIVHALNPEPGAAAAYRPPASGRAGGDRPPPDGRGGPPPPADAVRQHGRGLTGVAVAQLLPRTYVARTAVLVQPARGADYLGDRGSREATPVQSQVDMLREFIYSRNFMEPTLKRLGLIDDSMSPLQIEQTIRAIQANLKARATGASTFEVVFTGKDPLWPVRIVQAATDAFIAVSTSTRTQQTEDAIRFLERQMAEYQQRMAETREAVERFQARNAGLLAQLPEGTAGRLAAVEDGLAEARMSAVDAQMRIALIRKQLENTPPPSSPSGAPCRTRASLPSDAPSAAEAELAALRSRYTDEHPRCAPRAAR